MREELIDVIIAVFEIEDKNQYPEVIFLICFVLIKINNYKKYSRPSLSYKLGKILGQKYP